MRSQHKTLKKRFTSENKRQPRLIEYFTAPKTKFTPTVLEQVKHFLRNYNAYFTPQFRKTKLDSFEKKALEELEKEGIVILENYFDTDRIIKLQKEHERLLKAYKFNFPVVSEAKITPQIMKESFGKGKTNTYEDLLNAGLTVDSSQGLEYKEFIEKIKPHLLKVNIDFYSLDTWKMFLDERMIKIASNYMGCQPRLAEAFIRRSFPSEYPYQNNHWHRDTNSKFRFLKVFVILSNVTQETGPLNYVKGSHKELHQYHQSQYYEGVENSYPNYDQRRIPTTFSPGTVIIADTKGLHRADLPQKSFRDQGFVVFMPHDGIPLKYKFLSYDRLSTAYKIHNAQYQHLSLIQQNTIPSAYITEKEEIKYQHSI